jgi:hypothetical protein
LLVIWCFFIKILFFSSHSTQPNAREKKEKSTNTTKFVTTDSQVTVEGSGRELKPFAYDRVFDERSTQVLLRVSNDRPPLLNDSLVTICVLDASFQKCSTIVN